MSRITNIAFAGQQRAIANLVLNSMAQSSDTRKKPNDCGSDRFLSLHGGRGAEAEHRGWRELVQERSGILRINCREKLKQQLSSIRHNELTADWRNSATAPRRPLR
jgi:hypothetical protein